MKFLFLLLISFNSFAFDHDHSLFNKVLQNYVIYRGNTSDVNYKALKNSPKDLHSYLATLEAVSEQEFSQFSKQEQLAFWINAYNAYTLKLVIDHYPVESIKEIKKVFSGAFTPWDIEFIKLQNKEMDLNDIEHNIIRKKFSEPRIHFALVCASRGCPPLLNIAWTSRNLEELFIKASTLFIQDTNKNKINTAKKELHLSKIFDWYGSDFKAAGGYLAYIAPFISSDSKIAKQIKDGKFKVHYLDYGWDLNKK